MQNRIDLDALQRTMDTLLDQKFPHEILNEVALVGIGLALVDIAQSLRAMVERADWMPDEERGKVV